MEEQKIFYKLVDAETRRSSNWMLIKRKFKPAMFHPPKGYRRFYPMYKKGRKVNALPGTEGLYLFKSIRAAEDFASSYHVPLDMYSILEVKALGPITTFPTFFYSCGSTIDVLKEVLSHSKISYDRITDPEIVTCPSVRVLT